MYKLTKEKINKDFNPRPREEGDILNFQILTTRNDFNPRPREEGDTKRKTFMYGMQYFNPRPREEGDFVHQIGYAQKNVFQSTPS